MVFILYCHRILTFKNLLLTLWVRYECQLDAELAPVPLNTFRTFFEQLWTGEGHERRIKIERKTDFLGWLSHLSGSAVAELSDRYGSILEELFAEIEDEYAAVLPENLDPRFIHLFMIEK